MSNMTGNDKNQGQDVPGTGLPNPSKVGGPSSHPFQYGNALWALGVTTILRFPKLHLLFRKIIWSLPASLRSANKSIRAALSAVERTKQDVTFALIGANDGLTGDPLAEFIWRNSWRGVLVEPVPTNFKNLETVYGSCPRCALENAAISDSATVLPFYYLNSGKQRLPIWYGATGPFNGSLDRSYVVHFLSEHPELESCIDIMNVPAMTLPGLLLKHGIDRLDVLVVDAEGFDAKIVRQIEQLKTLPRVVVYESINLPTAEAEECEKFLTRKGYSISVDGGDTIAQIQPPL